MEVQFISQSKKYVHAIRDAIPILFELLEDEQHSGIRAVLVLFLYIYTQIWREMGVWVDF